VVRTAEVRGIGTAKIFLSKDQDRVIAVDTESDKKILLVDDEEGIRKVLGISLEDLGYQVTSAADGVQGLALFRQHLLPIVITDIKMPAMDGIDLLKQIKEESPDTEVIMLTGHGDMDLAIECLKLEATDFITKPINDEVLGIALRRAHERIRMRRQLRQYTENLERLVQEKSAQLVAAERRAAVGQALEGLTAAMRNIASDLDSGIQYFNDLPCLVSIHSPELKVVAVNQRYQDRLGDRIGKESNGIYQVSPGTGADSPVKATFQSGTGQRCQATARFLDGVETPVIVHTAPIRNATGIVELVVEIAADVSEIQRLQDELRATQLRYEQLFNEAPCYITVQDRALHIVQANRRFREDFDFSAGRYCHEVYRQQAQACSDCPVIRTFQDGQPHQCETDVDGPGGTKRRMLIWTSPLRDSSGQIVQVMEMSTDVTQVRKLQDQLSSLGLMIGSVSHGIKGLLTGLDGGMYDLDSGFAKKDLDRIQQGWDTVRLMIGRIRNLVLDILFYAKEKDLKWEQVDVKEFAEDIEEMIQPKIKPHPIDFRCGLDPRLENLHVDTGFMRVTLINIIENAIEACAKDPDRTKTHAIDFRIYPDQGQIVFEVSDNGMGMDDETMARIFTPFYISQKQSGTGLGLFIASQILEKNNGRITVSSRPGHGSRFLIRLPRL
jgi:FixJ family two-component response regulator/nitrogen-specific signal transduction histidine kinase